MPTVLSKMDKLYGGSFVDYFLATGKRKVLSASVILIVLFLIKLRVSKGGEVNVKVAPVKKKGKGNVDSVFFKRIWELLQIVVPGWKTPEVFDMLLLTLFLVARTFLSIYISGINGQIVKAIIKLDYQLFLKRVINLAICAVPASFVNSYLDFLNKRLSLHFRKRLTNYFHEKYIKDMIFYQLCNLDCRVPNPDQRLTQDIEKWAYCLSSLYSNFSKPLLDIVLFSRKLSELVGWRGPIYVIVWYFFSGLFLRFISPPFGKLTAVEQKLEGEYRACHTDLLHHSEEIAFYRGHNWEKNRINNSFKQLMQHSKSIMNKRLYMGCFDAMLVKYGAVLVGYAILGLPVFGPGRHEYLKKIGSDPSAITRDYVRNSSLLINLAKAIGRLVVSYKEIQHLAGYTSLVYEIKDVLNDLEHNRYYRIQVNKEKGDGPSSGVVVKGELKTESFIDMSKGEFVDSESIKFEEVPIVSPNGDVLVDKISFEIKPGMNCLISGPNGCGKSSLFRILGRLWPLFGGKLHRPALDKMFYIPQRPYLPPGTLRDQIIYPHNLEIMKNRGVTDEDVASLLEQVHLGYLIEREGGLGTHNDWNDVLSGGEKQRIAMARLFYHKPQFAILDECTSAVSMDVEAIMYNHSKQLGITLFTVSHRQTLFKFHEYMLKFDGEGGWTFKQLIHDQK